MALAPGDVLQSPPARPGKARQRSPWVSRALRSLVVALAMPGAAFADNLLADFSSTANPNGAWTYGYAASPGGSFTAYTVSAASNLGGSSAGMQGWSLATDAPPLVGVNGTGSLIDDGNVSLPPGVVLLHGQGTGPAASEVLWTAAQAGAYQVAASFTGYQRGMQANIAVFNDGSPIYSHYIAGLGDSASFSAVVHMLAGGALTFSVNRNGADPNGFGGNYTGLDLTITAVPEPGNWALMLAGLGGLMTVARRRRAD